MTEYTTTLIVRTATEELGRTFANDAERVAHLFDLYVAAVKGNAQ